jgi:phenylacetate-CoA ligase
MNELNRSDLCFELVSNGNYEEACYLLELIQKRLEADERDRAEDRGLELCLPLPLALAASRQWLQRRAVLSADPVSVLLHQAACHVPFYRQVVGAKSGAQLTLDDFPLISRMEIVERYDQFLSELFAGEQFKKFKPTSGTTGKPFIIWFDMASFYDLSYATYGSVAAMMPSLASAIMPGKLAAIQVTDYPFVWRASTVLPSLKYGRLERRTFIGRPERDGKLIEEMRDACPPLLCGMASSLVLFSELDRAVPSLNRRIAPTAIFVSGENLFEDDRARLEEWFRCQVFNAYTSSEGGLIALECKHRRGLHVQEDRVRLEVLGPGGKLSDEGCGEIVLTNFMNWAMPFIRYRTGDRATIRKERCPCGFSGSTLIELPGREASQFTASERCIDPRTLDAALTRLPIKQFTVIQEGDGRFEVNWTPASPEIPGETVETAIADVMRENLGEVKLTVRRLERLSGPGQKISRYINRQDLKS